MPVRRPCVSVIRRRFLTRVRKSRQIGDLYLQLWAREILPLDFPLKTTRDVIFCKLRASYTRLRANWNKTVKIAPLLCKLRKSHVHKCTRNRLLFSRRINFFRELTLYFWCLMTALYVAAKWEPWKSTKNSFIYTQCRIYFKEITTTLSWHMATISYAILYTKHNYIYILEITAIDVIKYVVS